MLQIPAQSKIFVGINPLDFRNGFNGTAAACRRELQKNPLEGALFVFINRSKTMVRIYFFDGHGEWSISKRAATGTFSWWKQGELPDEILIEHLQVLFRGGDPKGVHLPPPWKKLQ